MAIATVPDLELSAGPDFPGLFRRYIAKSVQITLAGIPQDAAVLTEEGRERALHVLSFALKMEDVWSTTRDLLLLLAPKLEQAGYRDDWLPYLEAGLKLSQACDDGRAEAELRLLIGQLHRLVSRFIQAREWLTASLQNFATLGDPQGQARALNQLAYVAWQQHAYPEAEQLAKRALALVSETDPERTMSLSALGLVAIDRNQWEAAERHFREALQIRIANDDQRRIAWSLQNLGYALRGQGKYTEARDCFEQAMTILEKIHDLANYAIAQMNLGIVYWLSNESAKALDLYTLAEHTFDKFRDVRNLGAVFNNKGLAYMTLHKWQLAENSFIASITLYQAIGDATLRLNVLDGLGLTYLKQGQYEKAYISFESALSELPQIAGTPMYEYLINILPDQLVQAKQKREPS